MEIDPEEKSFQTKEDCELKMIKSIWYQNVKDLGWD